jgi:hemolysin III
LHIKLKLREPFNGVSHLVAAAVAGIGLGVLLYLARGQLASQLSLLIYGISLTLMFSASAAYHLADARPEKMLWLRKLDHSAIYLLIAGTYTPICVAFFSGFWRWGILAIIWSMAFIGIAVKLFIIRAPRGLTAGIYLLMGWVSVFAVRQMLLYMPAGALAWLIIGGVLFTLGAVVYITKWPDILPKVFGFHGIWHIIVILAAFSHFFLILRYIAIE